MQTLALATLSAVADGTTTRPSVAAFQEPTTSIGRFDLNVERSSVLRRGKTHVDTRSAFATYSEKFFAGRTAGLTVHLYASPIDARARERLLKNDRDDQQLLALGAAYFVFLLDGESRITQANVTVVVPGTTVTRTVAYTAADIAKWFSDYHYDAGRLHLISKGMYVAGADSHDDKLTLAWDVALDIPVIDPRVEPARKQVEEMKTVAPAERALSDSIMNELGVSNFGMQRGRGSAGLVFQNWKKTDLSREALMPIARRALLVYAKYDKAGVAADTVFVQFVDYHPQCATFVWVRKPVTEVPDRFVRTKPGTPCRPPKS